MFKERSGAATLSPADNSSKTLLAERRPRVWVRAGLGAMLALILAGSPGCVGFEGIPGPKTVSSPKIVSAPVRSGNSDSYYHYLLAQRMIWDRNLDAAALYLGKAIDLDPRSLFLRRDLLGVLLEKGNFDKALEESSKLVAQNPDDVQTLLAHGSILFQKNDLEKAAETYRKILTLAPKETDPYFLLGEIYQKTGEPEKAVAIFEDFIKKFPGAPETASAWYFLGKTQFSQGHFDQAAKAFEETLRLKPELTQVRLNLVEAYEELENDEKVEVLYRKIMEDTPSESLPFIGLGRYYLRKKEPGKALVVFNQAREIHKQDPLLERSIAHVYLNFDYFKEAATIFAALHAVSPTDGEILYYLGYSQEGAGNKDQALEAYRRIEADSTYYAQALIYIAYITKGREDALAALTALKATVNGDHLETDYAVHAANMHEQAGNHELAVEILSKKLKEDPENITILFNMGILFDKQNRKNDCIDVMKRVVELKPDHADALNFLGYTYADLGIHLREARKLIAKALEISPHDGYITDSMGWVHFKLGEYSKALSYLKRAVELAPDDPVIREHLGDAYLKTGDPKAALEAYRISLPGKIKRGDDSKELEQKIKALEK